MFQNYSNTFLFQTNIHFSQIFPTQPLMLFILRAIHVSSKRPTNEVNTSQTGVRNLSWRHLRNVGILCVMNFNRFIQFPKGFSQLFLDTYKERTSFIQNSMIYLGISYDFLGI